MVFGSDSSFIKRKEPHEFASYIEKKDIEQTLNHLTEILLATYICSQFGFTGKLNDIQYNIYRNSGKLIAVKLQFPLPEKYNETIFIWARSNIENYLWIYKVWVILNKKYHDINNQPHFGFKYSPYFLVENIKIGEK